MRTPATVIVFTMALSSILLIAPALAERSRDDVLPPSTITRDLHLPAGTYAVPPSMLEAMGMPNSLGTASTRRAFGAEPAAMGSSRPFGRGLAPARANAPRPRMSGQGSPPLPPGLAYSTKQLHLASGHEYATPTGRVCYTDALSVDAAGNVVGVASRFSAAGDPLGGDIWALVSDTLRIINPVGSGYEYPVTGGMMRQPEGWGGPPTQYSASIVRVTPTGAFRGRDVWNFDGATTRILNLSGPGLEYVPPGGGVFRYGEPSARNAAGIVVGKSYRYSASGTPNGTVTWYFDGSTSRLVDMSLAYGFPYGSEPSGLNAAGMAVGSGGLGDVWTYDGSTLRIMGLTGFEYQDPTIGLRSSVAPTPNTAGHVFGYSARYGRAYTNPNTGGDAWYFDGSTLRVINPAGPGYEYLIPPGSVAFTRRVREGNALVYDDLDRAVGRSKRYSATGIYLGDDGWYFDGTTTQVIPAPSAPEYQISLPGGIYHAVFLRTTPDVLGRIWGTVERFTIDPYQVGKDLWYYDGSHHFVGLTGGAYEDASLGSTPARESFLSAILPGGQVYGGSSRYPSTPHGLGFDSWYWDGGTYRVINLLGGAYEYSPNPGETFRSGELTTFPPNASGQAVGTSRRFGPAGEDHGHGAWFFDPATGVTDELLFATGADGSASTDILAFNDEGVVIGNYSVYDGSNYTGTRGFWWDKTNGFFDLDQLVDGGFMANGWQNPGYSTRFFGVAGSGGGGAPLHICGSAPRIGDDLYSFDGMLMTLGPAVVAVEPSLPLEVSLASIQPNPSRAGISVQFTLPRASDVEIDVMDVKGRRIAMLARGSHTPGVHTVAWGGAGRRAPAAAGVYFLEFRAGGKSLSRRFVVLN